VALSPVSKNSSTFVDLTPSTTYTLCGYYLNSTNTTNVSLGCQTFTTPNDPTWLQYEAVFNYSSPLNASQRNSLLCYITTTVGANNDYILNGAGESCNSTTGATAPEDLWYNFTGSTNSENNDTIYLIVVDNSSSSQTFVQNFMALFNSTNALTPTNLAYINNSVSGVLLSGVYNGTQTYVQVSTGNTTATVQSSIYNQTGNFINITSVSLTYPGSIIFGVGYVNSTVPSQEQLLNC
jgi:hypothetical protein